MFVLRLICGFNATIFFLLESKKSIYDWVFLQNQDDPKDVHLITGPKRTVFTHNRILKDVDCISKQAIEILPEDDKLSLRKQDQKKRNKNVLLPMRSDREDVIRSAVRQSLFNLEILIHNQLYYNNWTGQGHRIFIPIIVTNTSLFSCNYHQKDIDSRADLTKMTIKPISIVAFNHSEILRLGQNYETVIEHIGQSLWISPNLDTRFEGSHNKTVFVVTKDYLLTFIDQMKALKSLGSPKHVVLRA